MNIVLPSVAQRLHKGEPAHMGDSLSSFFNLRVLWCGGGLITSHLKAEWSSLPGRCCVKHI